MDAYQAIIGKRDRREYTSQPIPDEVRHRILQAGRMAGSSSNNQLGRLIVLNDRGALERRRLRHRPDRAKHDGRRLG